MNSKMDTASSNPKFNWDSADLVGEWKAFRQHVEFLFKGPLRAKNEERAMLLFDAVGRRERKKNILHMEHDWCTTESSARVLW